MSEPRGQWRNHPTHPEYRVATTKVRAKGGRVRTRYPRRRIREWWLPAEVAAELGVSPQLVALWCERRWLDAWEMGSDGMAYVTRIHEDALTRALGDPRVVVSMSRSKAAQARGAKPSSAGAVK